jgi:hypothetical protein
MPEVEILTIAREFPDAPPFDDMNTAGRITCCKHLGISGTSALDRLVIGHTPPIREIVRHHAQHLLAIANPRSTTQHLVANVRQHATR